MLGDISTTGAWFFSPAASPSIGRHPGTFPVTHANHSALLPSSSPLSPEPWPGPTAVSQNQKRPLPQLPGVDRRLKARNLIPPTPPTATRHLPQTLCSPFLPTPHGSWESQQFRGRGVGVGSGIQQLLWGRERNSSFTPGPPGLKQCVQDLSLKISWGCLGVCLGLFLDLNLTVSGLVLMGTQSAQSLCFPTFLLLSLPRLSLSGSVLEAVRAPPLNLSLSVSSAVPLSFCLSLHTSQPSVSCGSLHISDWPSPNCPPL